MYFKNLILSQKLVNTKSLNRENRLECIRQSIRIQFDYRLGALVNTAFYRENV